MPTLKIWFGLFLAVWLTSAGAIAAESAGQSVTLSISGRTIHTFRAPLGAFSPAEREEGARHRIEAAFAQPGDGWTSVMSNDQGFEIQLDGTTLFWVLAGDANALAGETPEALANQVSRNLQRAWLEAKERSDPKANLNAVLRVSLASAILLLLLFFLLRISSKLNLYLHGNFSNWFRSTFARHLGQNLLGLIPSVTDRLLLLSTWLSGMFLVFVFLTYSLGQFASTRPVSESLLNSTMSLGSQALSAVAGSLPGLFIAVFIFLLVWLITRISTEFFNRVESNPISGARLNAHTAPATRRIVNASLWLFGIAMAYPYLPGSHTEAFKGLSVIVGLMVSIGASGVVSQIASGLIIVYTFALKRGEYVRIQDYEGTVTEISLFVTRLRTGMGEEIAIPNALVLGNVTRNFSRLQEGKGYVLDTTITIGYDTPWRQVHAMLIEAANSIQEITHTPAPYVVQTALSDFYVAYKLVVQVNADIPATRARIASNLHESIQDSFNRHGVQIMSPHYERDPAAEKLVPESEWYRPPAKRDSSV